MSEETAAVTSPLTLEERQELSDLLNEWLHPQAKRYQAGPGFTAWESAQERAEKARVRLTSLLPNRLPRLLASPTPSVDYSGGLRARLSTFAASEQAEYDDTGDIGNLGAIHAYAKVLAAIDEAEAAKGASLALLKEPRVGTTVTGEGFEWVYAYAGNHLDWFARPFDSYVQRHEDVIHLLRALVSSGAAYVTEGEA